LKRSATSSSSRSAWRRARLHERDRRAGGCRHHEHRPGAHENLGDTLEKIAATKAASSSRAAAPSATTRAGVTRSSAAFARSSGPPLRCNVSPA
jgi:hypothetical protein